ncbi:predicted protein [Streptomyces filamentosus NRRL 15998]|uniref:Predicted protein n=1 Tax=Streptomyces filamentosus NRRL 15998 TaxID=457431 RepID=D6AK61_STRFL|nr:predicted protein [Streptomyces filamentosus NRRL 15998]
MASRTTPEMERIMSGSLLVEGDSHHESFQDHGKYLYDKRCNRVNIPRFHLTGSQK